MAAQSTPREALKNLKEQLACPICLERFSQPRILPCFHPFCHDCLDKLPIAVQDGKDTISCPVCRQVTLLPDNGVSGFQSAFLVNHLLEVNQVLEKVCGSQQNNCQKCENEQAICYCNQCAVLLCQTCIDKHNEWITDHQILRIEDVATSASKLVLKKQPTMECSSHGKPLEVYCDEDGCKKLICYLCTTAQAHRGHTYEPLNDCFPKHRKNIVDSLDLVKKKLADITSALQIVNSHEEDFLEQVEAVRREIEATVQQLIQVLQESERHLIKELDQVKDTYVEKISGRKKEADLLIAQLSSCEEFTEEQLRVGSQQEILVMKKQMVERMGVVCSQVTESNLRPPDETRVRLSKNAGALEACHNLGNVVRVGVAKVACNKTTFDLCSAAPLSSELVSCQLSPVAKPTALVKCAVRQVETGGFEIHHPPPITDLGLHQLSVQVRGTDILDKPLVIMPRKPKNKFTGLSGSAGIVVVNNIAIVTECHEHRIAVLDVTSGNKIFSFGEEGNGPRQFKSPMGLAVTRASELIIVDHENHRLQVMKVPSVDLQEVQLVRSIGSKGSQPLQFHHPTDVAVDQNGKIYVVDRGNHRVQVLNADYSYSHCFGSKGTQRGEFIIPRRIVLDAAGMIYVSDYGNNRVQMLTPEGTPVAVIDSKGDKGPLCSPCGLCVVDGNGILYVTELNKDNITVCVYSITLTTWQFLGYFDVDGPGCSFKYPWFVSSDNDGRMYFSDCDNSQVVVY